MISTKQHFGKGVTMEAITTSVVAMSCEVVGRDEPST